MERTEVLLVADLCEGDETALSVQNSEKYFNAILRRTYGNTLVGYSARMDFKRLDITIHDRFSHLSDVDGRCGFRSG